MNVRAVFHFLILQLAYSAAYDTTTYPYTDPTTTYPPTTTWYPTSTTPPQDGCPVGWVQSSEGCFLFHHTGNNILRGWHDVRMIAATGLTWRQGQEECERLGGFLAEIKTEEQQAFLVRVNFKEELSKLCEYSYCRWVLLTLKRSW